MRGTATRRSSRSTRDDVLKRSAASLSPVEGLVGVRRLSLPCATSRTDNAACTPARSDVAVPSRSTADVGNDASSTRCSRCSRGLALSRIAVRRTSAPIQSASQRPRPTEIDRPRAGKDRSWLSRGAIRAGSTSSPAGCAEASSGTHCLLAALQRSPGDGRHGADAAHGGRRRMIWTALSAPADPPR